MCETLRRQTNANDRFAKNLVEVQTLGVKKGIYVGICQGLTNVLNYGATAVALWYAIRTARSFTTGFRTGTACETSSIIPRTSLPVRC